MSDGHGSGRRWAAVGTGGVVVQAGGGAGKGMARAAVTVFGLVLVAIGLYYLRRGYRIRRTARPIADDASTTAIADLSTGDVLVSGTAHPVDDATVEAPFTGARALAARAEARELSRTKTFVGWKHRPTRTLAQTQVIASFAVDDGTGRVQVDPPSIGRIDLDLGTVAGAVLDGVTRTLGRGSVPTHPFWTPQGMPHAERLEAFHERSDELDDDPFREVGPITFGPVPSYHEGTVEPGDDVYVQGTATEGEDGSLVITGDAERPFVLSDTPPDEQAASILRRGRRLYYMGVFYVMLGVVIVVAARML